jgi:hypothetical protein
LTGLPRDGSPTTRAAPRPRRKSGKLVTLELISWSIFLAILFVPIACLLLSIPALFLGIVRRAGYWDDKLSDYTICNINVALRPKRAWTEAEVEEMKLNPASSPIGVVVYSSPSALRALLFQRLLQHSTLYQRKDIAREIGAWLLYDQWPQAAAPLWPGPDEWPTAH